MNGVSWIDKRLRLHRLRLHLLDLQVIVAGLDERGHLFDGRFLHAAYDLPKELGVCFKRARGEARVKDTEGQRDKRTGREGDGRGDHWFGRIHIFMWRAM